MLNRPPRAQRRKILKSEMKKLYPEPVREPDTVFCFVGTGFLLREPLGTVLTGSFKQIGTVETGENRPWWFSGVFYRLWFMGTNSCVLPTYLVAGRMMRPS